MPARRERHQHEMQISFLAPDDAELLHRGRLALAELVAVYEARRDKRLETAPQIRRPQDIYTFVRFEMESLEQEQMRVLKSQSEK